MEGTVIYLALCALAMEWQEYGGYRNLPCFMRPGHGGVVLWQLPYYTLLSSVQISGIQASGCLFCTEPHLTRTFGMAYTPVQRIYETTQ